MNGQAEKHIELFYLKNCPYCIEALNWLEELKRDDPRYEAVRIRLVDERAERALAASRDYYYVPTCYVDGEKVHEGVASKQIMRGILEKALPHELQKLENQQGPMPTSILFT